MVAVVSEFSEETFPPVRTRYVIGWPYPDTKGNNLDGV